MACRIDKLVSETISSLDTGTEIQAAASFMVKNGLGSILVTDSGKVIGMFTEHDLLTRVVGADKDPRKYTLGDVCSRNLISIPHDSSCKNAIQLMRANNCRRLLIYHKDNLYGLVNISTVAHALAEQRGLKNVAVNLVGGLTLTVALVVIVMLIAILPDMLNMAEQAMQ